ncbi:hypothetical protein GWK47_033536 [Chionoecetes opilio]|uniref:Uncharacterized protein n=1 Tax=Chionoecetes opilio TaxID=41210 RepID=A0A8J4YRY4_CHIOP|nr:hypothetical protein GWK47_033536 [Chionoecetes opilio]
MGAGHLTKSWRRSCGDPEREGTRARRPVYRDSRRPRGVPTLKPGSHLPTARTVRPSFGVPPGRVLFCTHGRSAERHGRLRTIYILAARWFYAGSWVQIRPVRRRRRVCSANCFLRGPFVPPLNDASGASWPPHCEAEPPTSGSCGVSERLGITLRHEPEEMWRGTSVWDAPLCVRSSMKCVRRYGRLVLHCFICKPPLRMEEIAEEFQQSVELPTLSGAVDGSTSYPEPALSWVLIFQLQRTFSTILMGVSRSAYRFIYLDVGSYGREHDGIVVAQSTCWQGH